MKLYLHRFAVGLIFCSSFALSQTQPLLQITSPATGTIVSPGQTVVISVAADSSISGISVTSNTAAGFAQGPDASGQFSLTIPANTPIGQYQVTALGTSPNVSDLVES